MNVPLLIILLHAILAGANGGLTAPIDDHFANTSELNSDSSSGRWTMFLIVNLVIGAAVLYHKRDELISLWANRNLKVITSYEFLAFFFVFCWQSRRCIYFYVSVNFPVSSKIFLYSVIVPFEEEIFLTDD
jgi:hypothetical protein